MRVHVGFQTQTGYPVSTHVDVDGAGAYPDVVAAACEVYDHVSALVVDTVCDGHHCYIMRDGRVYELSADGRSERPASRGKARKMMRFFQPEVETC